MDTALPAKFLVTGLRPHYGGIPEINLLDLHNSKRWRCHTAWWPMYYCYYYYYLFDRNHKTKYCTVKHTVTKKHTATSCDSHVSTCCHMVSHLTNMCSHVITRWYMTLIVLSRSTHVRTIDRIVSLSCWAGRLELEAELRLSRTVIQLTYFSVLELLSTRASTL